MSRARIILLFLLLSSLMGLTPWLSIDGREYYMQLRSMVVDGDLNFYNEFAFYFPSTFRRDPQRGGLTPEGYSHTWFSIGVGLLCAPFYLAGFALRAVLARFGFPLMSNGYSYPEVLGFILASAGYGLIGLMLCFEIARMYFGVRASLLAVIFVWLGSPAMAYLYFEPSMSHSASIFTVSFFLLMWLRWRSSLTPLRSFALGLLWGLILMVRYQDAPFVLFPLYSIFRCVVRPRERSIGSALILLALLISGGIICFSPQFIIWNAHYGSFIARPMWSGFFDPLSVAIWSVLFSSYHGLFSWTPIILIAFIGMLAFLRVDRHVAVLSLVVFSLGVYGSSLPTGDWFAGWSFGARRFISFTPVFVLGLATLLKSRRRLTRLLLTGLCSLLALWNILFVYQYYSMKLPFGANISLLSVAEGQWPSLCELSGKSLRLLGSPLVLLAALVGLLLALASAVFIRALFRRLKFVRQRGIYVLLAVIYFLAWDVVIVYETVGMKRIFFVDKEQEGRRSVLMLTLGRDGVFQGMGEDIDLGGAKKVLNLENELPFSGLLVVSYCRGALVGDVVGRITVEYENAAPSEHELIYGRDTYTPDGEPLPRGPVVARTWYGDEVELPPYRTPLPLPLWLLRAGEVLMELRRSPPEPRRSYAATIFLMMGGIPRRIVLEAGEGRSLVITGLAFVE